MENTKDSRIKKRGDTYWAWFMLNGEYIRRSLKTDNFEIAKRMIRDIEYKANTGESWRDDKLLFSEAWEIFLSEKEKGKVKGRGKRTAKKPREKTMYEYRFFGKRYFMPFFGNTRVNRLSSELWEEYLEYIEENYPGVKIFNHWKYFSSFTGWLRDTGKLQSSKPVILYNSDEPEDDGVGKVYSEDELRKFRDGGKGKDNQDVDAPELPVRLWICMAQYMGMRSSEITQLAKAKIDLDEMVIDLAASDVKTATPRTVPIHPKVKSLLERQIKASGRSKYLFPNRWDHSRPMDPGGFKKPWGKLREDLGIEGRFHDFRHTYATKIFKDATINPLVACEALGMSIVTAQRVYIHFNAKDFARLTKAIDWS